MPPFVLILCPFDDPFSENVCTHPVIWRRHLVVSACVGPNHSHAIQIGTVQVNGAVILMHSVWTAMVHRWISLATTLNRWVAYFAWVPLKRQNRIKYMEFIIINFIDEWRMKHENIMSNLWWIERLINCDEHTNDHNVMRAKKTIATCVSRREGILLSVKVNLVVTLVVFN